MNGPARSSRDSRPDSTVIRGELDRILATPGFGTERRGRLLKFLIEKALAGEAVKEYSIGVDVFDKPPDYDPRVDPSVRVEIGRLRGKLAGYYERAGARAPVRIEIPKGSYIPTFEVSQEVVVDAGAAPNKQRKGRWVGAILAAAVCVGIAAILATAHFAQSGAIHSVVVLPFENLTGDPHNDYLADGVTEQLTDALAQVRMLRVVARTSAFQFKGKSADIREIGKKVGADAVVEGSLAAVDGKLRLTVQVNRSGDGYHIFSRAMEGGWRDLGRMGNEINAPVLAALQPEAAIARSAAPDPEAYDLFLRARAYRGDGTREASEQAIGYLHRAIEQDPKYADAYAALAGVYAARAMSLASDPMEFANQAKAAAAKALELNPNSGAAWSAMGIADAILLDWKRGEQELRRSIALLPQGAAGHNRLGLLLMAQNRFGEALTELQKAADLDPLITAPRVTVGLGYFLSRRYDEALRKFTEARDLHPEATIVHGFIGLAWVGKGQYDRALAEYKEVEKNSPAAARAYLAHLYALTGKRAEAIQLLNEMEHPDGELPKAFDIAAVYAALGEKDLAFRWLDMAFESRDIWFLKVHPFLDSLRGDARFGALLKKTGLGSP